MAETDGTTLPEELAALRSERARLWDLVRHQRGELHVAGLITDDELAVLISDHGAVARLEGYDEMRKDLAALRKDKARLETELAREKASMEDGPNPPASRGWRRVRLDAWEKKAFAAEAELGRLREFVTRYRRHHDGEAECGSAGAISKCTCSICWDIRTALPEVPK